ncbi:MAG: hypothetical protein WC994_01145 [Brumimicrobium sp.]
MTELYSDIPLWLLLGWGVVSVALALLLYRKKSWISSISTLRRTVLITLRSLGVFMLGLLLFGILIRGVDKQVDKPFIITIIDDSESMLNYNDSATVKSLTNSFLSQSKDIFQKDFNDLTFNLTEEIQNIDSLSFTNTKTNLSQTLNRVYNNYYGRNIGAIILLSDGNFNQGMTPLLTAEKFKRTPIYTLSVGDTIQKIDHLIESVFTNEIAFLGNKFPVEITIAGNKTENQNFELKLFQDGKLIQSKQLKHQNDAYSLIKTNFILEATSVGIHEFTVKIDVLSNEYNTENNEQSFFIEVLDDRSKILLVEETLNPDIGAIRSALIGENNLELENVSINELPSSFEQYDLIVWGNPGEGNNSSAFEQLKSLNKPKWYLISPKSNNNHLSALSLQSTFNINDQVDHVGSAFNQAFNLFKLSPEARKTMDNFPPISAPYGNILYGNNNQVLAYQKVGNIVKRDPLFYFGSNQNEKFSVTIGTGLWIWRIADYQINQSHQNINEIIRKTVQYLIVKENTSRLRINLPSISNSDEDYIMKAAFYNESYEPITEPNIKLYLKSATGDNFEYSFLPLSEDYSLNLGKLKSGKYTWKAATNFNGKDFQKEGSFAIKDLELEKIHTKANHQLLMQMAQNNHGEFAMLSDYQQVLDKINARDDIVSVFYESSTFRRLIDYWWVMLLIVSIFTAEWVIRRYSGGY